MRWNAARPRPIARLTAPVLVGTAALCAVLAAAAPARPAGGHRTLVALEQWLGRTDAPLTSYRALRRMTASARGGKMQATLVAWTELDPVRGFQYRIVEERGSESIRRRVFRGMLEGEREAERSGEAGRCTLVAANYAFDPAIEENDGLLRVGLRPRREHPMLVEGSMFLQPDTGDVVRVEGRLAKRPSFWTRRVDIVRRYGRMAGVHVPLAFDSTAQVLMVGQGTLSMTWEYERVNGVTVGSPGRMARLTE